MDRERFEELIYKFYNKELDSEERAEFEYFLDSFDECREIFHNWNLVYQATKALSIHAKSPKTSVFPLKNSIFVNLCRRLIRTVAIITIPLILGVAYLLVDKYKASLSAYNEVVATNAKVVHITLSDGSKVSLYAGSVLKYPDQFNNNERLIKLEGEATFEVKSDPKNPFYVETTDGTRVKAYGTKFSVCNYELDNATSVYLERGVVDFISPQFNCSVTMKPDTKLVLDKASKKYTILRSTSAEYDAYEQGILLFNNTPLEEVTQKLSRVYKMDIVIQSKNLKEYRFTATIKDESIYQILDMMSLSSPQLKWKREGEKIMLIEK